MSTLLRFRQVYCRASTHSHVERHKVSIETGVNVKLGAHIPHLKGCFVSDGVTTGHVLITVEFAAL